LVTEDALSSYKELLDRVDSFFSRVETKYPEKMECQKGCHSCCKPGLTVSLIEAKSIQNYLKDHLEVKSGPHKDRCALLAQAGDCQIYPVRPLICRSHGLPLILTSEKETFLDVCPLNFKEEKLESLPKEDVFNGDTLNTILATLHHWKKLPATRIALNPKALREASTP